MVWLLTVLSVLQWIAPNVDPSLVARLGGHGTAERVLSSVDHPSPALEARSGTVPVASEKRPTGPRSLPSSEDSDAVTQAPPLAKVDISNEPILAENVTAISLDGHSFTARSPPGIG